MISYSKTIVVLGATGQQGGAVVRALATDSQWHIRTISRNPNSETARQLADRGIEVVVADMDSPNTLRSAFSGAHGVYSVQGTDQGVELESKRGIAVADAALAAGVSHFIYASVGGAERQSGVPHFESKWRIEKYIQQIGLPATVVRPTFFMDNFSKLTMRAVLMALIRSYLPRNKPLQMIAVEDIGKWVARAFAYPENHIGMAEEIAGDELNYVEILSAFKTHDLFSGLLFPIPRIFLRPLPDDVLKMFEWFGKSGYKADIPDVRKQLPDLMALEDWLAGRNKR